jgi:hypothetical protein
MFTGVGIDAETGRIRAANDRKGTDVANIDIRRDQGRDTCGVDADEVGRRIATPS